MELEDALAQHVKDKGQMPEMDHAALARDYPVLYQSMLQLIHNSGERMNKLLAAGIIRYNKLACYESESHLWRVSMTDQSKIRNFSSLPTSTTASPPCLTVSLSSAMQ